MALLSQYACPLLHTCPQALTSEGLAVRDQLLPPVGVVHSHLQQHTRRLDAWGCHRYGREKVIVCFQQAGSRSVRDAHTCTSMRGWLAA